jgi:hypothetical protein
MILATLIAVVVSANGSIFIGADTAKAPSDGSEPGVVRKLCQTGPRSYAALSGHVGWDLSGLEANGQPFRSSADFISVFDGTCREMLKVGALSLEAQLVKLLASIKAEAEAKAADANAAEILRQSFKDEFVTVIVAGQEDKPRIVVASLIPHRAEQPDLPANLTFDATPAQFLRCGALMATPIVANALMVADPRIPTLWSSLPSVRRMAAHLRQDSLCDSASVEDAREFFEIAIAATIQQGPLFGLKPGIVNWPIDTVIINPRGETESIRRQSTPTEAGPR